MIYWPRIIIYNRILYKEINLKHRSKEELLMQESYQKKQNKKTKKIKNKFKKKNKSLK